MITRKDLEVVLAAAKSADNLTEEARAAIVRTMMEVRFDDAAAEWTRVVRTPGIWKWEWFVGAYTVDSEGRHWYGPNQARE